MMTSGLYYVPIGNYRGEKEWRDYIVQGRLAKYQANLIGDAIGRASSDQIQLYREVGGRINKTLTQGFLEVSDAVRRGSAEVVTAISGMSEELSGHLNEIGQGQALLNSQIALTNRLLESIQKLLAIPDSEKERAKNIQFGLKFLRGAKDDASFYDDALKYLELAHEQLPEDWYATHYIGLIRLYAAEFIDLAAAEKMFAQSLKYAKVESRIADPRSSASDDEDNPVNVKKFAAENCLHLATIYGIQGDIGKAYEIAKEAATFLDEPKVQFYVAKYALKSGAVDESLLMLRKAVEREPMYAEAILADLDLNLNKPVLDLLAAMRIELEATAENLAQHIRLYDETIEEALANPSSSWVEFPIPERLRFLKTLDVSSLDFKGLVQLLKIQMPRLAEFARETGGPWAASFRQLKLTAPDDQLLFGEYLHKYAADLQAADLVLYRHLLRKFIDRHINKATKARTTEAEAESLAEQRKLVTIVWWVGFVAWFVLLIAMAQTTEPPKILTLFFGAWLFWGVVRFFRWGTRG